jgi:hypothetical protein
MILSKHTLKEKLEELETAKKNVIWLLENDGLVDMKGITYWAGRAGELRQEIKNNL